MNYLQISNLQLAIPFGMKDEEEVITFFSRYIPGIQDMEYSVINDSIIVKPSDKVSISQVLKEIDEDDFPIRIYPTFDFQVEDALFDKEKLKDSLKAFRESIRPRDIEMFGENYWKEQLLLEHAKVLSYGTSWSDCYHENIADGFDQNIDFYNLAQILIHEC